MKSRRLLRHNIDLLPTTLVLLIAGVQVSLFFFVDTAWVVYVAVLCLLPFQTSALTVNHNQHHQNFFNQPFLNRLFESIAYFQTGTSPYSWTLHHNIGHHQHYLDQTQDTSRWKWPNGRTMGHLEYVVFNTAMIYPEIVRVGRGHPAVFKKFARMLVANNLILLAFIVLDPLKAMVIFVLPMLAMLLVLVDTTYKHHVGLDVEDHFEASTNKLSYLYNLCMWNLGYHTAHHLKPGIHWTQLPALHREIEHRIPSTLTHSSTIW